MQYQINGKPVTESQIVKLYETHSQRQLAEMLGIKVGQVNTLLQRNGARKIFKTNEEQIPPKPKRTPPKGATVRIKEGIAKVIASYPFHFTVKVNYGEAKRDKTVNRWEFWEVI